jgi:2-aminoethylphosphonate-pyruvate transaminase
MKIDTAVILAAGQGSRLRAAGVDYPKGFVRIGDRPIVEESILRLRKAGIRRIVIVTGFSAGHYQRLAMDMGPGIELIYNPDFAETGSMFSLYCAREAVTGPYLLLESDLVYEPRALNVLLARRNADAVLLSGPTNAGDEVFVKTRDGRLIGMSKDRHVLGAEVAGELVGISCISVELHVLMNSIASAEFGRSRAMSYETDCMVTAARTHPIACPVVPDLLWGEIDDSAHLERVRTRIYPRIAAMSPAT